MSDSKLINHKDNSVIFKKISKSNEKYGYSNNVILNNSENRNDKVAQIESKVEKM